MKRILNIATGLLCLSPAALAAVFLSPLLMRHGSSSAFDLAIGLPIFLAVAGIYAAALLQRRWS